MATLEIASLEEHARAVDGLRHALRIIGPNPERLLDKQMLARRCRRQNQILVAIRFRANDDRTDFAIIQSDEYGEGLLEFSNGVVGSLAAGWVDVAHPVNLIISGTEAHAYVANGQVYFKSEKIEGATGETPWTDLPEAWPHAFELFLDALVGKPNIPLVSAQEAAVRSAVMEALYTGAQRKQWVAPKKFK